jgi:hypothetical protein
LLSRWLADRWLAAFFVYPVAVNRKLRTLLVLALSLFAFSFANAAKLSGTVTNKTTNTPAAGDDVALLDLMQGMNQAGSTKTDARGHYSFDLPNNGPHLIQVTHGKASYYASAPPGTPTADITVYDAAPKVAGIAGGIDAIRIESDPSGSSLNVIELINVRNDSNPPRTQSSDRSFDFYLPEGAVLGEDASATGPGNGALPLRITPVAINDVKNHYAVDFALRPGESLFQISYTLPYKGSLQIKAHPSLPTDMVAVMVPKSMTFKAPSGSPFAKAEGNPAAETVIARSVPAGEQLAFTVSGTGQLPQEQAADQSGNGGGMPGQPDANSAPADNRPGGGMGAPIDTPDPLSKYKWWIIGILVLALAAVAGFLLSKPTAVASSATLRADTPAMPQAPLSGRSTLDALKEEIFTLETDRLSGKLSEADYAEHRAALEIILKRAINRG